MKWVPLYAGSQHMRLEKHSRAMVIHSPPHEGGRYHWTFRDASGYADSEAEAKQEVERRALEVLP